MTAENYFQSVVEEVFAGTLRELGARKVRSTPLLVRFEEAHWFVELLALPEDGPHYSPRVEIGPLPERGVSSREKQIDVMHTVPADSPLRRYNLEWRYTNATEMREAYTRIRDEIFIPRAIPVLRDRDRLSRLVALRAETVQAEWTNEIATHNDAVYRAKAQAAIAAKDYAGFIEHMMNIPEERQSDAEKARIRYAQKQVSK